MIPPRLIPILLIDRDRRVVKTVGFGDRTYLGDPFNIIRLFFIFGDATSRQYFPNESKAAVPNLKEGSLRPRGGGASCLKGTSIFKNVSFIAALHSRGIPFFILSM